MVKNTNAIKSKLYKLVSDRLSTPAGLKAYRNAVAKFIDKRSEDLYDTLPCARMFFGELDAKDLFDALQIEKEFVTEVIKETYYGDEANFNPKAAQDPFTVIQLTVVRFFYLTNKKKELELSYTYLSFSGKFYPSLHYRSYPTVVPVRHVMEYVVNNCLSNKYDLISAGSIIGAVQSIAETWVKTYGSKFKDYDDEDVVYLIQQLHSRIGSFMKNIATEYYKIYDDKDKYMTYDSDSFDADDYHLADSDSLRIQRISESAMTKINNNGVDYRICKMCSDENVSANEIKSIIEAIVSVPENNKTIKELVDLIIILYYTNSDVKNKDVRDLSFITYSIAAKPNAKQKEIVREKEIIETWLMENSPAYIRRRSRNSTKSSYHKAILMYFVLIIHNANR